MASAVEVLALAQSKLGPWDVTLHGAPLGRGTSIRIGPNGVGNIRGSARSVTVTVSVKHVAIADRRVLVIVVAPVFKKAEELTNSSRISREAWEAKQCAFLHKLTFKVHNMWALAILRRRVA
jgi:hypothetical protein